MVGQRAQVRIEISFGPHTLHPNYHLQDPSQRICRSESRDCEEEDGEESGWAGGEVGEGGGGGGEKVQPRREGALSAGD